MLQEGNLAPEGQNAQSPTNIFDGMVHYNTAEFNLRHLLGKVLTIADAVIVDKDQNKAAKDLIKSAFRDSIQVFQANCFNGKLCQTISAEPLANESLGLSEYQSGRS